MLTYKELQAVLNNSKLITNLPISDSAVQYVGLHETYEYVHIFPLNFFSINSVRVDFSC